jgi:thiol-disulfide isomerase/thioredoxin
MASRMSKKTWLILAIVIIAIGAIIGIALSYNSSGPSEAVNFTVPISTWNETTLSTLEGTPVVLNFWSTSCYWCRKQLPYLEDVAQESEGEMEVIAINIGESASRIQSSLRSIFDHEPTMTIALDTNREAFVHYCLTYNNAQGGIPFTLFIDSEGIVEYVKIGAFASETALRDTLHSVFGITVP